MTEQAVRNYEEDEITLLDILGALAESWKLLVFGPLIAGMLAGGLSFLSPETFESVTIMRMTEEELALLHTAPVLDPLIEKFGLLAQTSGVVDDARQLIKARLTYVVDKKTKLASITAKGRTPDAAQALGSSAVTFLLKELQIKGQDKILLEKTISINLRAIQVEEDAIESIQHALKKGGGADLAQESAVKNLVVISADIARRSQENEALRQKLEPKGAEVFVQESSLPQRKTAPKRKDIAILAAVAVLSSLLLWIFIRNVWQKSYQDEKFVRKISEIKKLLGFK